MSFAQYPENSPLALNGKLKVEYGKMVNECGYPTQLRGMSTHGLAWNKNTYNESSIKTLEGYNNILNNIKIINMYTDKELENIKRKTTIIKAKIT